jgi:hypothetical protein
MHARELGNKANGENPAVDNHIDRLVVGDVTRNPCPTHRAVYHYATNKQ